MAIIPIRKRVSGLTIGLSSGVRIRILKKLPTSILQEIALWKGYRILEDISNRNAKRFSSNRIGLSHPLQFMDMKRLAGYDLVYLNRNRVPIGIGGGNSHNDNSHNQSREEE